MPRENPKPLYIKVRFNFDAFESDMITSLSALPGVISAETMYPDDPALFNIALVKTEVDDADTVLEQAANFEFVEYAEIVDEPEIRGGQI